MAQTKFTLPVAVSSPTDVGRLLREVEGLREFLKQAALREPGTSLKLPKTSRLLDETISANNLNVLLDKDCQKLETSLKQIKEHAPLIHMSFSVDPSALFIQKLMTYLRSNIHPQVLLRIGLQPNIGAGVIVRTTNKIFDFSLRQRFAEQSSVLLQKLREASDSTEENTV